MRALWGIFTSHSWFLKKLDVKALVIRIFLQKIHPKKAHQLPKNNQKIVKLLSTGFSWNQDWYCDWTLIDHSLRLKLKLKFLFWWLVLNLILNLECCSYWYWSWYWKTYHQIFAIEFAVEFQFWNYWNRTNLKILGLCSHGLLSFIIEL